MRRSQRSGSTSPPSTIAAARPLRPGARTREASSSPPSIANGPAAEQGVRVGDRIVEVAQEPVSTPAQLAAKIKAAQSGRPQGGAAAGRGRRRHALRRHQARRQGLKRTRRCRRTTTPLLRPFAALRPTAGAGAGGRRPTLRRPELRRGEGRGRRSAVELPARLAGRDRSADGNDPYAPEVYAQAARRLRRMIEAGVLIREARPCYYAYRMTAGGHVQTGIAAAGSVAAYRANRIRRHEHTRPDKELDRTRQIEAVGAHTGPVLTVHAAGRRSSARLLAAGDVGREPIADAMTDDGTRHQIWRDRRCRRRSTRSPGASRRCRRSGSPTAIIARQRRRASPSQRSRPAADAAASCSSAFPADEVRILDYNRVVRDLNGQPEESFLAAVAERFVVEPGGGCRSGRSGRGSSGCASAAAGTGWSCASLPVCGCLAGAATRRQPAQRSAAGPDPRHRRPAHRPAHRLRRRRPRPRRPRGARR